MTTSVRFSQKDFRRGVDDAMTLAPLREAVRSLTLRVMKSGTKTDKSSFDSKEPAPGKGVDVHGRDTSAKQK